MCEHHHKHGKSPVIKILIASAILAAALLGDLAEPEKFFVFMFAYMLAGGDVLLKALKNILKGQIFDENFLMSIATIGAIALKEYPEAVMVMLLYQTGEYFQHRAVEKS